MTSNFVGARLTQAREYRQMTKLTVADLTGVVSSTLSKWENDDREPRPDHVDKLAQVLNFDRQFFYHPIDKETGLHFWRSQSQALIRARERASSKLAWLRELTSYVWRYYDTPRLNMPPVRVPRDFTQIGPDQIEDYARQVREFWGLGTRPIENLVRTLEQNGIIVARCDLLADKLDALSEFSRYPFIVLSTRKASAVRSRFDAAHELGHILMHKNVTRSDLKTPAKFKLIENQAHKFASALLLPEEEFTFGLWSPTLQALREKKEEWKVSIACMLMRCRDLRIITEAQCSSLQVQLSKRKWRRREPLDNVIRPERPRLLAQCFESLIETVSPQEILRELRLPAKEVEEICGLKSGFFAANSNDDELNIIALESINRSTEMPRSKDDDTDNVIEFDFGFSEIDENFS